jgi:TolB-like protein/DNA-binding winged helix-turn-helix (wHTH) protein/Tfp pilus assembly protein PilF
MGEPENNSCDFGPFHLDLSERQLFRDGKPVSLTPKAFETLVMLVSKRGHVVEKDDLLKEVWKDAFVEEANISRHVWMLRKTLGENENGQSYIETIPRRGYRFLANVQEAGNGSDQLVVERRSIVQITAEEDDDVVSRKSEFAENLEQKLLAAIRERQRWPGWRWGLGLSVLSLLVIGVGGILYRASSSGNANKVGANVASMPSSIAVLPFVNGSNNPDVEYLSDGVTESLINSLSQLPAFKVIARNSSFKYRGKNVDPQEVARALGVEAILTGRVTQRGNDLLISVELVDARDNTQMWGDQYNRKATDLLAVQSEISHEIAEKLRLRLTPVEHQQLAKRETVNPQAYELSLKGRFYWRRAGPGDRKKSIEYYQQAIAVDPDYALAYTELSSTYIELISASVLDPKEFMPKAEDAARKALELDESLAEAHLAMSKIRLSAWDWAAAEREIKRAIELNPNLPWAHNQYAFYLSLVRRHEQALSEIKHARELDPLSTSVNHQVGVFLLMAHQYDQAIEAAKKTLELDPNYANAYGLLGYTYKEKGQYREAIAAYQEAIKLGDSSPDIQIYLGAAYAKAGQSEKAQAILKRLETGKEYVSPEALAGLHVALDEREQAFALLARAYSAHDHQLIFLDVEPEFDPLRSDPRFTDLMRRVGFTQQSDPK